MKKIVIIGPESTGKSTLCAQLSDHYHTVWVKEYAREYLLNNGKAYTYDNLLDIAKGQIAGEEKVISEWQMLSGNAYTIISPSRSTLTTHLAPLFIDTDMYVMKVWCEFVFEKCHHWILNRIAERQYDLYLLCNTDLPWVKDELREYPDPETRKKLFLHYKDCMVNQQVPWVEISGDYETRLRKAIDAVEGVRTV